MNLKHSLFIIQIILIRNRITSCSKHYNKNQTNRSDNDRSQTQQPRTNVTNIYRNETNALNRYQSTVESIADLYYFSSDHVRGIFNCTYEKTINISQNALLLANGSYIYDQHTLIPPQLVGTYDYEILYNGTQRKVPTHKRACICQLKSCITLCSNTIPENYKKVRYNATKLQLEVFTIDMTLSNKNVVRKNVGKDFEAIVLEEFCAVIDILSPEQDETKGWTLFENGTLMRHSDQVLLKSPEYCFDLHEIIIGDDSYYLTNPRICAKSDKSLTNLAIFNYWIQVLSVLLLLAIMIIYSYLPERQTVYGKCFLSYMGTLSLSFLIFSILNLSQITFPLVPCLLIAYFNHYLQLCHYSWLGVISYHVWRSSSQVDCGNINYEASYAKYSIYGFTLPLLMTLLAFAAQTMNIPEDLQPGISEHRCGLDVYKWSATIYLYGPCLIVLLCCLIWFILTSRILEKKDNIDRYTFYIRLFVLMGISWFLDILSYVFYGLGMTTSSEITDYVNSLQGFYIFISFIGQQKSLHLIKERFVKRKNGQRL